MGLRTSPPSSAELLEAADRADAEAEALSRGAMNMPLAESRGTWQRADALRESARTLRRRAAPEALRLAVDATVRLGVEECRRQRGIDAGELNHTHPLTFAGYFDALTEAVEQAVWDSVLSPDVPRFEPDSFAELAAANDAEADRARDARFER
jgi:hypothetical protein